MAIDTYETVGSYFGLDGNRLTAIRKNNVDDYELQKLRFLELWKQTYGHKATYGALASGFLSLKKQSIAECIVQYVKNNQLKKQLERHALCTYSNNPEVHILITGPSGTGKSSLTNALMGQDCQECGIGAYPITGSHIVPNVWEYGKIKVNMYDTRGLFDGIVKNREILAAVKKARPAGLDYDVIIVCMKFTDRFTDMYEQLLQLVHELSPDTVSKVHIALTHTDLSDDDNDAKHRTKNWENNIKGYILSDLDGWNSTEIAIHSTAHVNTRIRLTILKNWLPRLMLRILCNSRLFTFPTALTLACTHPSIGPAVQLAIDKVSSRIFFSSGLKDWVELCKKGDAAGCEELCTALQDMKHITPGVCSVM